MAKLANVRAYSRQNPVQTTGTVTGAVTALLGALSKWGIDSLPDVVPGEVSAALCGLAGGTAAIIGAAGGRGAQRLTEPAYLVDELVEKLHRESDGRPADDPEGQ